MTDADSVNNGRWRLDHKIPLPLIASILVYAGAMVYWGAQLDGRVNTNDKRITTLERIADRSTSNDTEISNRLTMLETKINYIQNDTGDLKASLEHLLSILAEPGKKQ